MKKTKKPREKTKEELENEEATRDLVSFMEFMRTYKGEAGPENSIAIAAHEEYKKAEAEKARKKKERADRKAAKKAGT